MKPVNPEVVRARALAIRQQLETIERYASLPDEQFWEDERNLATVKLAMIQMFQDAADLCNHLSVRMASRAPSSYPECFEILGEIGVLPSDLAERLTRMMRFRNLLVHQYSEVDNQRVLEYARTRTGDLEAFLHAIGRALPE